MMKKWLIFIFVMFVLTGCNVLNFQTEPKIQEDCQYAKIDGPQFRFEKLTDEAQVRGYTNVYVAKSKSSSTLSYLYEGMVGKLTGNLIDRSYSQAYFGRRHFSPFRNSLFYDDYNDYFYLSSKQREERILRNKSIFQQAILENCEIVYISVDPLTVVLDNPALIENAGLKIIH